MLLRVVFIMAVTLPLVSATGAFEDNGHLAAPIGTARTAAVYQFPVHAGDRVEARLSWSEVEARPELAADDPAAVPMSCGIPDDPTCYQMLANAVTQGECDGHFTGGPSSASPIQAGNTMTGDGTGYVLVDPVFAPRGLSYHISIELNGASPVGSSSYVSVLFSNVPAGWALLPTCALP